MLVRDLNMQFISRCFSLFITISLFYASTVLCHEKESTETLKKLETAVNFDNLSKDFQNIRQEVENYCAGKPDKVKEQALAEKLIAYSFDPKLRQDEVLGSMILAHKMREKIRQDFPNISTKEIENNQSSVGAAIYFNRINKEQTEEGINVLIREARLMSAAAQIALNIIYLYPVRDQNPVYNHEPYDPRILEYVTQTARLGMKSSQRFLGSYYLQGSGVIANEKDGITWLEKSGLGEAYLELATYYINRGDSVRAKKYWQMAADKNLPEGFYNLGILEQEKKSYKDAVRYFEQALELNENYHEANLELARMYIEGWGVPKNVEKGFRIMEMVSNQSQGKTRAIAEANLGIFYLNGIGTKKSISKAKVYLTKAMEGGVQEAKSMLDTIEN